MYWPGWSSVISPLVYLHLSNMALATLQPSASACVAFATSLPSVFEPLQNPVPYFFPNNSLGVSQDLFPMQKCKGITISGASIDELQRYMTAGQLDAVTLTSCYVERIGQINRYVNAVLEINPDWYSIAHQLDEERAKGCARGPLHGIPFLVKDNIASKDRMETTAGSWALLGSIVPRDAHVVSRLRDAGAVLLGKATLSEWADMRSSNYSEGYSGRGGQARSAYNFTVNPGGSSTGSAIAVSLNIVPFALGTETDGSVINPAERNAIVGIKPTVGLTSRAGVIPESTHQDSVGTLGKTVRDATYALDAIYGIDPRDSRTYEQKGKTPSTGYASHLSTRGALKGARIGVPWTTLWTLADPDQLSQLLNIVDMIRSAGAVIVNGTEFPDANLTVSPSGWDWKYGCDRGHPEQCEYTVVTVDFYNNIKAYLAELNNTNIRGVEDLVQYNIDNDGSEGGTPGINPAFGSGQDGFLDSLATKGEMNATYLGAVNWTRSTTQYQIDTALGLRTRRPLDALLFPPDVAQSYQVANQAGYPMITIPAGVHSDSHMPFGLGLMGAAFSEAKLIELASAIEDIPSYQEVKRCTSPPLWHGYQTRIIPVLNA